MGTLFKALIEATPADAKAQDDDKNPIRDLEPGSVQQTPEPQVPRHSIFTKRQKQAIVLCAALTAFLSPLSSQIYLPALPSIAEDLHVSNSQINITITTYMIVQAIFPIFVGSLADSGGRRPAYIACLVVYISANIGLGLAPNYGVVLGLRCLQAAGSSPTVALCSAVIADIATSAERGTYVGITGVPAVLGPALGPIIGGLLSQGLGWRSIFWFLAILSGATLVSLALFFPETCRLIVHDGSVTPPRRYRTGWQLVKRKKLQSEALNRTESASGRTSLEQGFKFKMPSLLDSLRIIFEQETGVLLVCAGIIYSGYSALSTSMSTQLADRYNLDETQVALMYLPLAAGSILATAVAGFTMNRNYKRYCTKMSVPFDRSRQMDLTNFPIERARLEIGIPLLGLGSAGLVAWGWAIHSEAHLAVIGVISAIIGVGMMGFNNTVFALLVDIHPGRPGAATAASNVARMLLGAGANAAIAPMSDAVGVGWAFTVMGAPYVVFGPVLVLLMVRGIEWRAKLRRKQEDKQGPRTRAVKNERAGY